MFRSLRNNRFFFSIFLPVYLLLTFAYGKGLILCLEENGHSRIEATFFRISPTDISKISNICMQAEMCSEKASCGVCLDLPISIETPSISPATYKSLGKIAFYTNLLEKYPFVQWESLSPYNHFETNRLFHSPRLTSIRTIVLLI